MTDDMLKYDMRVVENQGIMLDVPEITEDKNITYIQDMRSLGTDLRLEELVFYAVLIIDGNVRYRSIDCYLEGDRRISPTFVGPIHAGRYGLRYQAILPSGQHIELFFRGRGLWPDERVI